MTQSRFYEQGGDSKGGLPYTDNNPDAVRARLAKIDDPDFTGTRPGKRNLRTLAAAASAGAVLATWGVMAAGSAEKDTPAATAEAAHSSFGDNPTHPTNTQDLFNRSLGARPETNVNLVQPPTPPVAHS